MGWLSKLLGASAEPTGCSCSASSHSAVSRPEASPPRAEQVSPTSPACLLAASLTDPQTRGEWEYDTDTPCVSIYGSGTRLKNRRRDLYVSRYWSPYSGYSVYTPFTLSKCEQKVVVDAIAAFERHLNDERERAALARLTASAIEAPKGGETAKTGSTRRARARPAKRGTPK